MKKITKTGLIILPALALALLIVVIIYKHDQNKTTSKLTSANTVSTRRATSEGKSFDVPTTVPQSAITDYILITDNPDFKIRQAPSTTNYIVTLYAIINRPDQYNDYKAQLSQYKQEALSYLKNNGIDTSKINITYEPSEATNL